jgi:hypothetical protein
MALSRWAIMFSQIDSRRVVGCQSNFFISYKFASSQEQFDE